MNKEKVTIILPQFDRTWELDYDYIPQSDDEFHSIINNAPIETLMGMGFCKWEQYNEVVKENEKKPIEDVVSIPVINSDEDFKFDFGRGDAPTEALQEDKWILLFPAEWYNKIPNAFEVFGLFGEKYPFQKGKTDDDTRFGCLAYGILK